MTVTFISCFLNHHQIPLCEEFSKKCDNFYFIETDPMPEDRRKLGYGTDKSEYDFVVRTYDSSVEESFVYELLRDSDVVIFGSCPDEYIEYRMNFNKLSFLYSERFFKKGVWRRFIPTTRRKVYNRVIRFKDKELYALCASSFLPWDLSLLGYDTQKCFKWGYFPQVICREERQKRLNPVCRILWAGRMLSLKHADLAVKTAAKLKAKGLDFCLDFVGMGECEEELRALTKKLGLEDSIHFLGAMPHERVIEQMECADVFLMTSDFREGWGAVVNEAMSTGCSVLVSSAVGSTAYLVEDGYNGLVYQYGSSEDFESKLLKLVENKELRENLGQKAFETIKYNYSASVAVERLMEFVDKKGNVAYTSGPMSEAQIVKNNWYKR